MIFATNQTGPLLKRLAEKEVFTGEKPYPDAETEQKALENAFKALTGVPEKEETKA